MVAHNIKLLKSENQTSITEFQRSRSITEAQSDAESEVTEMKEDTDVNESSFSEHADDF